MTITTTIKAGESAKTITLNEGHSLVLTGAAGSAGVAYLLDLTKGGTNSIQSWSLAAGASASIGPYANSQKILLTCSAGSFDGVIGDAVLSAPQITATNGLTDPRTNAAISTGGKALLSGTASCKMFGGPASAVSAGMSIIMQQPALAPYYGVKLIFENKSAAPITFDKIKVASAPTHQNDGAALVWVDVLTGGAAGITVPAGVGTSDDVVGGLAVTDQTIISSVPRTDDVTKLRLLQSRIYSSAAASAYSVGSTAMADLNASAAAGGGQWASRIPAGDQVTSIVALAPLQTGVWVAPVGVIYDYGVPCFTAAGVADSLTQGQGTTSSILNWMTRLQGLRAGKATLFQTLNFARTNQKHPASMLTGKNIIPVIRPNCVFFFAWSPNDTGASQAIFDRCWAETLDFIEFCRRNGVIPIPCTSGPVNSQGATADARLKVQNDRIRALGITYCDFALVIENPADRTQILPVYSAGDGTHYNDLCHAAMAAVADAAITAIS